MAAAKILKKKKRNIKQKKTDQKLQNVWMNLQHETLTIAKRGLSSCSPDGFINGWSSLLALLTLFRDPADNAPASPDWRTPSNCANLQAPRDTWVQLRTASLVEPTHHVSVWPPAVTRHPYFLLHLFAPLYPPSSFHSFIFPSVVALTWTNCATSSFIPLFFSPVLNQSPMCASALFFPRQIWSPPSYATAQILHGLPLATIGTRHLSARTKLKCNSHFNIIVIVIMRHSLTFFPEAAFIFLFFFLCSFANQSLPF